MAPAAPPARTLSCPAVFEDSCWEWCLGGSAEEPGWELQVVRVSQEDGSLNWGLGFKKRAREEMRPAAGMKEGRRRSDPGS